MCLDCRYDRNIVARDTLLAPFDLFLMLTQATSRRDCIGKSNALRHSGRSLPGQGRRHGECHVLAFVPKLPIEDGIEYFALR
jgi:hypothetical protein